MSGGAPARPRARAHRLAQACEGARIPALTILTAPLPLTSREREIVTLAAGGLSNRQVADRLVVSVRTVEGHLYRACAKLGDTELAALDAMACSDAQRAQAAIPRLIGLAFTLHRPTEAEEVLDAVAITISDDAAALELARMRSVLDAFLGRTAQAAEAAAGVLAHPRCSPAATQMAGWGLAMACGGLGRLDGVEETLRRIDTRVESFEIGLHQAAVVVDVWLRALLLGGLVGGPCRPHLAPVPRALPGHPGPGEVMTPADGRFTRW